jgi:hypothetical protein
VSAKCQQATSSLQVTAKKKPPIPADKDSYENRKPIADAMVAGGHAGKRTLGRFQEAGMKVLGEIVRPPKFNWFGLRRPRRK